MAPALRRADILGEGCPFGHPTWIKGAPALVSSHRMPPPVIVLVNDMMFESRLRAAAGAAGTPLVVVRGLAALGEALSVHPGCRVIVDMDTESVDVVEAVRSAKAAPGAPRVVAYLSHVRQDLAAAAREAGADEVLPRSQFVQRLPDLIG